MRHTGLSQGSAWAQAWLRTQRSCLYLHQLGAYMVLHECERALPEGRLAHNICAHLALQRRCQSASQSRRCAPHLCSPLRDSIALHVGTRCVVNRLLRPSKLDRSYIRLDSRPASSSQQLPTLSLSLEDDAEQQTLEELGCNSGNTTYRAGECKIHQTRCTHL